MTPVKTFFEIVELLKQSGKIQHMQDIATATGYNYDNLSSITHKPNGVSTKLFKKINDAFDTDFVKSMEQEDNYINCQDLVKFLQKQNEELINKYDKLQDKYFILIDKVLQLGIK